MAWNCDRGDIFIRVSVPNTCIDDSPCSSRQGNESEIVGKPITAQDHIVCLHHLGGVRQWFTPRCCRIRDAVVHPRVWRISVPTVSGIVTNIGYQTVVLLLRVDRAPGNAEHRLGQVVRGFKRATLLPIAHDRHPHPATTIRHTAGTTQGLPGLVLDERSQRKERGGAKRGCPNADRRKMAPPRSREAHGCAPLKPASATAYSDGRARQELSGPPRYPEYLEILDRGDARENAQSITPPRRVGASLRITCCPLPDTAWLVTAGRSPVCHPVSKDL